MTDTITLPRAVGIVLEGFTLPDAARKILETAYFAEAALAQQAEQVRKPNCAECAKWVKEQADDKEWHGSVARGREIVSRMAAALKGGV